MQDSTQPASAIAGRRRRTLFLALTLSVASVVALVLLEAGARLLAIAPQEPVRFNYVSDPFLPWKPAPNSVVDDLHPSGEYRFHHAHNRHGFRDEEHTLKKPAGVLRVVALGDSFTYGFGVDYELTFLVRLEARLNATGTTPVEVINLAIPRYWPEPERLMLEHYGVRYEPDLVIVGVVPNDLWDTKAGIEGLTVSDGFLVTRQAERVGATVRWLYIHSYAARAFLSRLLRGRPQAAAPTDREEIWKLMQTEYRTMVKLARTTGAPVAFFHIPHRPPWGPGAADLPRRLEELCHADGCFVIDALPRFQAEDSPRRFYYKNDGHCNAHGHELLAQVLYRGLVAHGLLPDDHL